MKTYWAIRRVLRMSLTYEQIVGCKKLIDKQAQYNKSVFDYLPAKLPPHFLL